MTTLEVDGRVIETDNEGYLCNANDWTPNVAKVIAVKEGLVLTEDHWEVIRWVRHFYEEYGKSPSIRPLVNYLKQTMGPEKGNSIFLAVLFPGGVAKQATKLAGLPKPARCT